jgi:hypothetical protein
MNVTPTLKMYEVFKVMADQLIGEAPSPNDMGPGAIRRRDERERFMQVMHKLVGMAMREGAGRYVTELAEGRMHHG